ncbi:MAG: hypothetical protein V3T28_12475, partial [Gemmatimonadales bacterium]
FVIAAEGQNRDGLPELLRILVTGDVEVRQAQTEFRVGNRRFAAGTYVVDMYQPYAGFAKTLLEVQQYPEQREYPGGPLKAPYDVTAHTLPLMMGVEVVASDEPVDVELSEPISAPSHDKLAAGLTGEGADVRIALYDSWRPSMDIGWTRWILDEYGIEYQRLRDADARVGDLKARFDAIILPDQPADQMISGHHPDSMALEYVGGLGEAGVSALEEFVEAGGTLIAFNRGSMLPIEQFDLPVVNVADGLERSEFYVPGSILRVQLESDHWLADGMPARTAVWVEGGFAFEPSDGAEGRVEIVGRYGEDDLLLSGWINGGERIEGKAALVVVRHGQGRVVLFGFRPQYRAQTIATYGLMFNALTGSSVGADSASETGGAF